VIVAPLLTVEEESLSHCLHCAINESAQQGFERGETDLPKIPSMIAEVIRPPDAPHGIRPVIRAQKPSGSPSPPLGLDHRSRLGRSPAPYRSSSLDCFRSSAIASLFPHHVVMAGLKYTLGSGGLSTKASTDSASRREPRRSERDRSIVVDKASFSKHSRSVHTS
jgi:hypothetical protein